MKRSHRLLSALFLAMSVFPALGLAQHNTSGAVDWPAAVRMRDPDFDLESRRVQMRNREKPRTGTSAVYSRASGMTRKEWDKRAREITTVAPAHLEKYKAFLAEKGTGIFRLSPMCMPDPAFPSIDPCSGYMYGFSYYSFAANDYTVGKVYEIGFAGKVMNAAGYLTQGIFVPLGDQPIEDVSESHAALRSLAEMQPVTKRSEAAAAAANLTYGVLVDNFRYTGYIRPMVSTTYGLRTIQYQGEVRLPGVQGTQPDPAGSKAGKRADKIMVFRILDIDAGGIATVVWKELSQRPGPPLLID